MKRGEKMKLKRKKSLSQKHFKKQIKEDIGTALFSFSSREKAVTDALINMAAMGYMMLENAYPKNISVNIE